MYEVYIDHDSCIGCGECKEACPEEVLDLTDYYPIVVDEEGCAGCGNCVEVCRQDAIFVNKVKEPLEAIV
ncbi:MAG: 4Fe-4S binding protein [Deltaproteobacteria bacterium]|nr:4Fe-4S binding protein [Deltaproteobacteria bacterium]MBW1961355.1 4Fe-4S binding protein [Deltaproteobacteria bacterium]MBW2152515.1 4Fe-4S binding protein [Deltaproteobacteria bacterium]